MFQVCAPLRFYPCRSLCLHHPSQGISPWGSRPAPRAWPRLLSRLNISLLSSSNREQAPSPLLQLSSQAAFSSFLFLCYLPVSLPELLAQFLLYNLPKNPPEAPRSPGSSATQRDRQHEGQRGALLLGPDTQSCSEARNSHHPLH